MRTKMTSLVVTVVLAGATAQAQELEGETTPPTEEADAADATTPAEPAPAESAPVTPALITWDGLVDTYYAFKLTSNSLNPNVDTLNYRVFDTNHNSFTLNYARLGAQIDTGVVGGRIDVGGGSMVSSTLPTFQQAYMRLNLMEGKLRVDLGRFTTWAGAERINANENWLYSRSFLFGGIGRIHDGVRAVYAVSDTVAAGLSLQNQMVGTGGLDNNGAKTIGLTAGVTATETLNLGGTIYIGKENTGDDTGDIQVLIDLVATLAVRDDLALNLNVDWLNADGDASWFGMSAMGRFLLNESLFVAGRLEFVTSSNGGYAPVPVAMIPMGADVTLFELTAMLGIPFSTYGELRLEGRGDFANEDIYRKGMEPVGYGNQISLLVAGLVYTN